MVDKLGIFSENQAISGDVASTNAPKFKETNPNKGAGTKIRLRVQVTVDFSGSVGSIVASLQDSANGSAYADILKGPSVSLSGLKAGTMLLDAALPESHRQWIRTFYDITGTNPSGGAISAWLE
jgi:hypothetical protein